MAYKPEDKEKIFNEICFRISEGESLREIFEKSKKKEYPDRVTFYDWLRSDEEKHNRYARAMELRALLFVDEILEISDDKSNDTMIIKKGGNEFEVENKEWVNRSRLRVDSRKWIASKLFPKQFGDRVEDKEKETGDNEIIIRIV